MKLFLFLYYYFVIFMVKLTRQQDTNGCGTQYGCYLSPSSCEGTSCKFIFKWSSFGSLDYVRFIIMVNRDSSLLAASYVAIGLSNDQQMGDDSVSICKSTTSTVEQYHSSGKYTPDLLDATNASIGLSNITVTQSDSWLICSFTRINKMNHTNLFFDLSSGKSYYVLASHGELSSGDTLEYHGSNRAFSSTKVSFSVTSIAANDNSQINGLKTHGCLMVLTWCLLVPIGILFARYFKYLLASKTCCNVPFWFVIHRPLLVISPIIAILAFIIVFSVLNWKWVDSVLTLDFVHSIFGIITIVLAVVQSILGFSRCDVGHKYRYIYNHTHRMLGILIFICSVIAMFTGVCLKVLSLHRAGVIILSFWLAITVLTIIVVEVLEAKYGTKGTRKAKILTVLPANEIDAIKANKALMIKKLHIFKTQIFIIYLFINAFLTFSVIAVIAS